MKLYYSNCMYRYNMNNYLSCTNFFAENGLNQIQKSYDELKNWLSAWREEADVDSFLVCKELQNGRSLSKGINIVQLVIKILLF